MKKILALEIVAAGLFAALAISGVAEEFRKRYLTDFMPTGWNIAGKTEMVEKTTSEPEEQTIVNPSNTFVVGVTFSGDATASVSNAQYGVVNLFGYDGTNWQRYGVAPIIGSGGNYGASFGLETGQPGASNNVPLVAGSEIQATAYLDSNVVYSVVLGDNVQPGGVYLYDCTNLEAIAVNNSGPDSDEDGLGNAMEIYITGTHTNNADSDGDGQGDGSEYFLGSDGTLSNSVVKFSIKDVSLVDGKVQLTGDVKEDVVYRTMKTDNLVSNNWDEVGVTNFTADGSQVIYSETNANPRFFYRIILDTSLLQQR